MKKQFLIIFLLAIVNGQSQIKGDFKFLAGQELELIGYNNFRTEVLSITSVDSLGSFTLIYPKTYKGMAILKAKDKSSLAFILTEVGLKITGIHLKLKDSLKFINSKENKILVQYFEDYKQRQEALFGWHYLKDKYQEYEVLNKQKIILKNIDKESSRIEKEDSNYLNALDKETYVSWFLPLKKLVSDMPIIVRHKTEHIPSAIKQFRNIDFNNPKFKTSGLLKDLIGGHYLLLENSGQSLDSISAQMNKSTNYLLDNLSKNEELLNETSDYLFDFLEKRSLHKNADYLAVQLLSNDGCVLDKKLTNKLEAYHKLKLGSKAPDIIFSDNTKLSSIASTKLLVFGASWCPKCKEDTLKLKTYYTFWKQKGIDIVYVSIDTDKIEFEKAYNKFPWKTDCDFKGSDGEGAKNYHVFATPTYFLLDKDLKIVLRPKSIEQINSWINSKHKL